MKSHLLYCSFVLLPLALLACSTSEEAAQQSSRQAEADSLARRRGTNFTTDQDTVVASVVKQSKTTTRSATSPEFDANVAYTVQIGAFVEPQNALRAQRVAKERFSEYPVFNQFEATLKLYRVSIGKFDSRDDALSLLKEMMKLYSREYMKCWINTIEK